MTQLPLLAWTPPQIFGPRDGETFEPKRDTARLNAQMQRVYNILQKQDWRNMGESKFSWFTLRELSQLTGDPEASISARIRDLRKPKFGGFDVQRRYVRRGLFEYRLEAK